jgi:hypothetical protein
MHVAVVSYTSFSMKYSSDNFDGEAMTLIRKFGVMLSDE